MATTLETVTEQALSLSTHERLRLAKELLDSVEPEASQEVERAWEEEIAERIRKIDTGTAKGRSWEEIKKDFDSRYGGGEKISSTRRRSNFGSLLPTTKYDYRTWRSL